MGSALRAVGATTSARAETSAFPFLAGASRGPDHLAATRTGTIPGATCDDGPGAVMALLGRFLPYRTSVVARQ